MLKFGGGLEGGAVGEVGNRSLKGVGGGGELDSVFPLKGNAEFRYQSGALPEERLGDLNANVVGAVHAQQERGLVEDSALLGPGRKGRAAVGPVGDEIFNRLKKLVGAPDPTARATELPIIMTSVCLFY